MNEYFFLKVLLNKLKYLYYSYISFKIKWVRNTIETVA